MMDGYTMWTGLGWFGMGLTGLFCVGVIALLIWGVSTLYPASRAPSKPDALDILQRRYARGEITNAEYVQAQEALR